MKNSLQHWKLTISPEQKSGLIIQQCICRPSPIHCQSPHWREPNVTNLTFGCWEPYSLDAGTKEYVQCNPTRTVIHGRRRFQAIIHRTRHPNFSSNIQIFECSDNNNREITAHHNIMDSVLPWNISILSLQCSSTYPTNRSLTTTGSARLSLGNRGIPSHARTPHCKGPSTTRQIPHGYCSEPTKVETATFDPN